MSAVLEHARDHYFKGAAALTLFGDLSAVGGVPTYDAYGIQVPKPEILSLPFTLSQEQEEILRRNLLQLHRGLGLEEAPKSENRTLTVTSSGFPRKRRRLSLTTEGQRLMVTIRSVKDEALLDTLLRETVLGDALIEYWIRMGFFRRRSLEDFDKQFVVEAALDVETQKNDSAIRVTPEDAEKELEKARKLLLEITPKSLSNQARKNLY